MVQTLEENFLYLVVLGGKANNANVELHDVRWVVGSKIEDTFNVLRRDWFGLIEGLHIDSFKKIKYVDGYSINLKKAENNKIKNQTLVNRKKASKKTLWFVNVGGYEPNSMQEKHEFGLVVASSALEAKNLAKSKWLIGCKKKHKDDLSPLNNLIGCYDCQVIEYIGNWEIELSLENNLVEESNSPDWYGYRRIDYN